MQPGTFRYRPRSTGHGVYAFVIDGTVRCDGTHAQAAGQQGGLGRRRDHLRNRPRGHRRPVRRNHHVNRQAGTAHAAARSRPGNRSNDMPIMQVHYPEDALDDARKANLARRLTDVLIAMEGGADTRGGRAFAWVLFTPVKPGDWWVGGRQDDHFVAPPGRFLVHVTIPEGYMNARHKSEVHASVNAAIMAAMGVPKSRTRDAAYLSSSMR